VKPTNLRNMTINKSQISNTLSQSLNNTLKAKKSAGEESLNGSQKRENSQRKGG
jgi:hypothetical protein